MDSLPHEGLLVILAEVAVALAGFAGIIAAIGKPDRELARQEIRALVVGAAFVLLGSLIPLLLRVAPIEVSSVWRISSGLGVVSIVAYYLATSAEGLREVFPILGDSWLFRFFLPGDLVMVLSLSAVAFGFGGSFVGLIYIGSLFFMLLQVVSFFIRAASPLWNSLG